MKKYQDAGHTFVKNRDAGMGPFQAWMNEQANKKPPALSKADAEVVVDKAYNFGATSEARAYVGAALAALQAGNGDEAVNQLKTYASALKDGHAASPAGNSTVEAALIKELQDAYPKLSNDMKAKIHEAINAAKKQNPDAWIANIKLPK